MRTSSSCGNKASTVRALDFLPPHQRYQLMQALLDDLLRAGGPGDLRPLEGRFCHHRRCGRRLDRRGVALARRRIGVVHQDCDFLDHLDVEENVALLQRPADILGWLESMSAVDDGPNRGAHLHRASRLIAELLDAEHVALLVPSGSDALRVIAGSDADLAKLPQE